MSVPSVMGNNSYECQNGSSNHSFIFDPECQEEICTVCGFVAVPSYKRFQKFIEERAEQKTTIAVPVPEATTVPADPGRMMFAMSAIQIGESSEQQQSGQKLEPQEYNFDSSNNDELTPPSFCDREFIISKTTELDFSCGGFLSTKIDQRNVDFVGKHVNTQHFNKIRYINNYIMSSTGMTTYKNAIWMVASYSDKLHLPPHTKERAAEVFRKIYYSTTNIHNSKNNVCACIYFACKEAKINRSFEDIAFVAEEDPDYTSEIYKTYQKIIKLLDLKVPKNFDIPSEISFLGSKLRLDERNTRLAMKMYTEVKSKKQIFFSGRAPRIVATTLLFIAILVNNQYINQKEFCKNTNVTEYILRNRVRDHLRSRHFEDYKKQILPKRLLTI